MGTSVDRNSRRTRSGAKCRPNRLQNESRTTGGVDIKVKIACLNRARPER
jgi:hypothetical protein